MEKVPSSNRGRQVTGKDVANAKDYFEHFLNATSLKNILGYYRSICDLLNLKPNLFPLFYPKLRGHLTSWRAKALWKKFDARATHKCYGKGKLCSDRKVLIIGAGPCGLRTAIEAQLLGAKVVVIEKRDRLSRNNVLHLWPFVIEDLRALGAKKFFGKFCAGSIDHISIRQLQCILLKVALLLGVEVHTEVSFERLIEPDPIEKRGWRAEFEPINHPVSQYEFDVIIGADGKRNTLQGFKRKEFRGKLAIAITANFINKRTEAEARVEEISGVAFIFNQKFFKDLYEVTGIDLENIVYYKDDTHYFVMTAKKPSLIEKGVIKQDLADTERLLAPDNVNREALMDYAREAANFSTNYQMPDLEFAVNHYGQPDVAMFDFTSMYAAENASKFVERHGFRLLMILVGDSLLEPFWPTGSGCARGFLSSLDAAWAIRSWSIGNMSPLDVLAERESIYRLLAQTTPDNLNKDWKAYTVDPTTRYPNLNKNVVMPHQTLSLFDTDNPVTIERMRRNSHDVQVDIPKKRRRENVDNDVLLNWISEQIQQYEDIIITDIASVFRNGKALCAILDRYRPDLLDYNTIKDDDPVKNNQLAIDILEKEIGISPVMTGEEITNTEDYLTMAAYLTQVYDSFRGEIPHIVHPRLPDYSDLPLPEIPKVNHIHLQPVRNLINNKNKYHYHTFNDIQGVVFEDNNTIPFTIEKFTLFNFEDNYDEDEDKSNNMISDESIVDFDDYTSINSTIVNNLVDIIDTDDNDDDDDDSYNDESLIIFDNCGKSADIENISQKEDDQASHYETREGGVEYTRQDPNSWLILTNNFRNFNDKDAVKFPYKMSLSLYNRHNVSRKPNHSYDRVESWISQHSINEDNGVFNKNETKHISSFPSDGIIVEERSEVLLCDNIINPSNSMKDDNATATTTTRLQHNLEPEIELNENNENCNKEFSMVNDVTYNSTAVSDDFELPEAVRSETIFKSIKPVTHYNASSIIPPTRPSSKHKRHADSIISNKSNSMEKKMRKRRTLDKVNVNVEERKKTWEEIEANRVERQNKRRQQRKLQTERFLKSMQMLQANAKPDSPQPFEDYSIFLYRQTAQNFEDRVKDLEKKFTYIPDHENKQLPSQTTRGNVDEDFAAKIKSIEEKWKEPVSVDKKPKDLLRAIGKIETSDWNIKEIEKKILENKLGKPSSTNKDKEKVPKWSKEEFLARQTKMEKKHLDRQDSSEAKFADIDRNIKHLELKLKEGTVRDLGQNKVASITEKLGGNKPTSEEPKPIQKSQSRPVMLPAQGGSEFCHFCGKRVYLMERLSAEGRFFHHGCFKCQYCHTQLRLGSYAFDKDGLYDHKFFCIHHFGMKGELKTGKVNRKPSLRLNKSPEKKNLGGIAGLDLLDRVRTPERVEFSNLSAGIASSDHDESLSQMDEDEWTDKNFGASAAELGSSDDDSFSASDSDDEDGDDDAYEEALEEPATKEGTMKWAERFTKRYSKNRNDSDSDDYSSSDQSSYYENTSDDDDSETATEGEEEIRARELRKQEVQVEPPVVQNDTGTDTEIVSDESTSESSSEVRNSATEISTDSEFAHDDPTPTREIPSIVFNDFHVTKTRGSGNHPKRIQVTSGYLQKPINKDKKAPVTTTTTTTTITATATTTGITSTSTTNRDNIELNLTPLVPSAPSIIRKTAPTLFPRTEGFALNRTQSTGGIAAKVSLELKKKYLLGENSGSGSIQKSGSASTLDTKLKSFHTNITDCQKMLKPASEIYANTTQTYYNKLNDKFLPNQTPKIVEEKKSEEKEETPEKAPVVFENELEGRPRSPLLETSIIVPKFDWSKNNTSHTEDSLSDDSTEEEQVKAPIPILQIEEFPPDSLCVEEMTKIEKPLEEPKIVMNDPPKSIATEKKTLNQPKQLPILENKNILPEIHNSLHVMKKQEPEVKSGRSTPSDNDSVAEQATAALTETELSDWARDGEVSDDLEDVEFDWNMDTTNSRYNKQPKIVKVDQPKVDKIEHVCGKDESKDKIIITEAINNMLSKNLENIEFMDTGTETSSDDGVPDSQNGYILLKNEEELVEDSLNPNINTIIEAKNENVDVVMPKNTGYCILAIENNKFGSEVIDLNPEDLEKLKSKNNGEHDEDSLLILDTGTTTEDNTCSDSTVKNITEISADHEKTIKPPLVIDNNNFQRKRLEEKLAKLKAEAKQQNQSTPSSTAEIISSQTNENNVTFDEHCQRLQSKIEFGNAKDSIDIRKSKRKSKDSPQKPDLIQEESSVTPVTKDIMLDLTPTVRTPDVLYKKEYIERERDVNQRLVQEMVMSKLKAENKSLERRKRRGQITPNRLNELTKSATTDIVSEINKSNLESSKNSTPSSIYVTPDLIPTLKKSPTVASVHSSPLNSVRPISVCSTSIVEQNKENSNIIESKRALFQDDFKTPVAPPRLKHEEAKRTAEKLKQDARVRARLMSNEELGLSPEDKLKMLKEKFLKRDDINIETVTKPERSNSWLYSNDTLNRKKRYKTNDNDSNPIRTKSIPEISVEPNIVVSLEEKFCKSDPNILETVERKQPGVKKDRERRKSITKMFTTLFKKSPSGNSKSIFSKMSPKKDISKEIVLEEPVRRKSFSETNRIARNRYVDTPPPVPPLPLNYTGNSIKGTDESSDGENDWKKTDRSSCDTLDQSGILDNSISSSSTRKSSKSARRTARQSQLKRHRLAQEIQRKLEETEVKTRELEERGVTVEKALRGEESGRFFKEESELLQEWFDLMRDRTELRRYEKELMVRAQELELEDRHARLQHELRERLENNDTKTEEDVAAEGAIIKEMMQIVAQRDSLIALLQEERLRYSNEDRDFEEQMLVKGLRLTPIQKTPEK